MLGVPIFCIAQPVFAFYACAKSVRALTTKFRGVLCIVLLELFLPAFDPPLTNPSIGIRGQLSGFEAGG